MAASLMQGRRVHPAPTSARGGSRSFGKHETDESAKAVGVSAIGAFDLPFAPRIPFGPPEVSPVTVAPSDRVDVTP